MLVASTPGAPSLSRTFSHASATRRMGISNDLTFSFGPPVGSFPWGLASKRPDLPGSLGSGPITGPSSLLRAGPPLFLPVLGLLRCWPLERLPLASGGQCRPIWTGRRFGGNRFSRSMPAPATSSRHLNTGHHQGGGQGCPLIEGAPLGAPLSRGSRSTPVSMPSLFVSMRQQWYRTCSSSRRSPDPLAAGLLPQRSPPRLLTAAACGGLGSPPARRARRANLHHWHSTLRGATFS